MLFIFRKLRRSSFKPGKVRTYVAYAIGEITLIIVGIFLALQLNNWNEGRRNKALEQNYIGRIISDLQQDLLEVETVAQSSFYQMMIGNHVLKQLGEDNYIQTLINANKDWESISAGGAGNTFLLDAQKSFTSTDKPKEPSFGICIRLLSAYRDVDIRSYTYSELIANGRFEVITDSRIRGLISDYYGLQADRSSLSRYIMYGEEGFNEAKSKYNLPVISDLSFEDFMANHDDFDPFIVAIKNLIVSHMKSHAAYHINTRKESASLLSDLEAYAEIL